MKLIKAVLGLAAAAALVLALNGCEAAEKKSKEIGGAPQKTLDNAKKKIADIEDKMKDRLNQVQ